MLAVGGGWRLRWIIESRLSGMIIQIRRTTECEVEGSDCPNLAGLSPQLCLRSSHTPTPPLHHAEHLRLSSLLLLSHTFSCSPLNLMVPSSSLRRPCDSRQASVLYYSTPPWGSTHSSLHWYIPLSLSFSLTHTHTYTQGMDAEEMHTHTFQWHMTSHVKHVYTGILETPHAPTSHNRHITRHNKTLCINMLYAQDTKKNTVHTHPHAHITHGTQAFTHTAGMMWVVTLDTGSIPHPPQPPCGGCHVWMHHTGTCTTGVGQDGLSSLMDNRSQCTERRLGVCEDCNEYMCCSVSTE